MEDALNRSGFNPIYPHEEKKPLAKLLIRYRNSVETEHEQASLRLIITCVGVFYLWLIARFGLIGNANEQAKVLNIWTQWWWPGIYFLSALVHIASLLVYPARLFLRRTIMLLLDNALITLLVSYGGLFNPFAAFYFWIAIGYGFRYGPNWLAYSASVSVACFTLLLYLVPTWNAGSIFGYSIILCLCVASGHAYHLLRRLKLVQQKLLLKAKELENLATRDTLTGLANRALLMDRLVQAINSAVRTKADVALFFVDVDGLKKVNDQIGHAAGDILLIEVAKRLQARLRTTDTCARIAGDEFVIVLESVTDRTSVLRVADTMLEAVRNLTTIADQPVKISASIGVAWLSSIPEQLRNQDSLLAAADSAMYDAKRSGGNKYSLAKKSSPTH